jgi:hypothetical protein
MSVVAKNVRVIATSTPVQSHAVLTSLSSKSTVSECSKRRASRRLCS